MTYRQLGRTGLQVSRLVLGTMNFGGRTSEADSHAILRRAVEAGINMIDTANVYGHDPANFDVGRGRSEEIIGSFLKDQVDRKRLIIATKSHFPMSDDPNDQGNSRNHIVNQCEASLRRLGTDYIDLFQLHHPSNDVPIDETLRALDDLITAGKIRYIGTSSFAAWQLVESLWASKALGLNRFVCEQPVYNLLDRRVERELLPMASTYGLGVITWSPTAGGLLSGKYRRNEPPPKDSRFDAFWKTTRFFTDRVYDLIEHLNKICEAKGCSMTQLSLAWLLSRGDITAPIIGPRTVEQLEGNLKALDIELTDEELASLDELAPPGDMIVPFYGHDGFTWTTWGPHQHRW